MRQTSRDFWRELLAEGIPAPPPFTSYLGRCVESSRGRSVYEQMRDDG